MMYEFKESMLEWTGDPMAQLCSPKIRHGSPPVSCISIDATCDTFDSQNYIFAVPNETIKLFQRTLDLHVTPRVFLYHGMLHQCLTQQEKTQE